ncbi:uncharacterized protein LOC125863770 [Solanum stenotomum]|uniref:uncharacterized protein LOC125863770 n=1 Tax=Solanum stenotomum TaxID=172797 RepID=UPI0020D0CF7B|nr:uncharacterized protein LOC125863770 [Solanum stenotomum]
MGEASKWLVELPRDSITSWDELITAFQVQFFPPSKMINLRDGIVEFRCLEDEQINDTWLRFKDLVLQYPTHGLPDKVLQEYFYRGLDLVNRGVVEQLSQGGILRHPYIIASQLLDCMTKRNRAWHTREDQVSPLTCKLTKELIIKYQERDQNFAKIMTQLHTLAKNVMEFEALYNKKVNLQANQKGNYHAKSSRPGGNKGWNREGEKDRYVPPHEIQKPKDSKSSWKDNMLSHILHKVEESNKVWKELKKDVMTLHQMVTSYSIAIKQLKTQMGQILSHLNPRQLRGVEKWSVFENVWFGEPKIQLATRRRYRRARLGPP